jgi:DNA-binding MarR family transcriptional regulator
VDAVERRRFYDALQRLLRIYQFRDRDLACYGDVSPDECYALEAIEASGPMRVNDLAAALNLHKSNASRLAGGLEAKRYVARSAERGDGRAVRLRMTPRGRAVHAAIRARVEAIHAEILAAYPPATRAAVVRLLGELADEAQVRVGGCTDRKDVKACG